MLREWGCGERSSERLQDWMVEHFDPDEIEVAPCEPDWTREAMSIVMNEYELAKPENFVRAQYSLAVAFVECSETGFETSKARFIRDAFVD